MSQYEEIFDYIKINLSSPDLIKSWGTRQVQNDTVIAEIENSYTIHYRKRKPEPGGLFCERLFGPTTSYHCSCGRYTHFSPQNFICEVCGVELTVSTVRRYRMGLITLYHPIPHIWFSKGRPNIIASLLGLANIDLQPILDFVKGYYFNGKTTMGGETLKYMLEELDLPRLAYALRCLLPTLSQSKLPEIIRRIRLIEHFISSGLNPSWMILEILPVLPPELRPMLELEAGNFATHDLNELYRRIINRNIRLGSFENFGYLCPLWLKTNDRRLLQQAVENLIENGKAGANTSNDRLNRPLKSLTDILKGKEGRFRQNLLGKRVDYSARTVIVSGPDLSSVQCGIPKLLALEIYRPFIAHSLIQLRVAKDFASAENIIETRPSYIWKIVKEVAKHHPVLINRAPSLHQYSMQAFLPVLCNGKAVRLPALSCAGFNADFDGDQVAIHLPLSIEAQYEARILITNVRTVLNSSGMALLAPSQDALMGVSHLSEDLTLLDAFSERLHYFSNFSDVIRALSLYIVHPRQKIWVCTTYENIKFVENHTTSLLKERLENKIIKWSENYIVKEDLEGNILQTYLKTTPGRILLHYASSTN
jgi:DNA-directed RNA polymerase subunit beta'